jgi:hypothetical protein
VTLFDSISNSADRIGITDSNATATLHRVRRGNYTIWVRDDNSTWTFSDPREVHVQAGEVTRVAVDVVLFDGELTLQGGTPASPLPRTTVSLALEGLPDASCAKVTTDALGVLHLPLPAGRWTLTMSKRSRHGVTAETVKFEWGFGGPTPRVLVLK